MSVLKNFEEDILGSELIKHLLSEVSEDERGFAEEMVKNLLAQFKDRIDSLDKVLVDKKNADTIMSEIDKAAQETLFKDE